MIRLSAGLILARINPATTGSSRERIKPHEAGLSRQRIDPGHPRDADLNPRFHTPRRLHIFSMGTLNQVL